jgi:hypothetical protein
VIDAKREIAKFVAENSLAKDLGIGADVPLEMLRLREMMGPTQLPGKPFVNGLTIKDTCFLYTGKNLAIQLLDTPEPMQLKSHVLYYVQRWHPSTLTLGPCEELILLDNSTITDLREALASISGLGQASVSVARAGYTSSGGLSVLEAATELEWDKIPLTDTTTHLGNGPLFLRDCDVIVYKDLAEKAKELSITERQQLEKAATSTKGTRYTYSHHESALKIRKDRLDS